MSKSEEVALALSGVLRELSPKELSDRFRLGGNIRAAILRVKKPEGWERMVGEGIMVSDDGKYFEIPLERLD